MSEKIEINTMTDMLDRLIDVGIYQKLNFSMDKNFLMLSTASNKILYCPICGDERTFKHQYENAYSSLSSNKFDEYDNFHFTLKCTHCEVQQIKIFYIIISDFMDHLKNPPELEIQKVGQYPSIADLQIYELKGFKGIIPKNYLTDFYTATGLFSHGVGAGSYVYLRRIIEFLVEDALSQHIREGSLNPDDLKQMKFADRIKEAKDKLPKFLVDNKKIYGIVSKGIHELSEKECLEYFPVLKQAIKMILSEKKKLIEEEKRKKELETELNKISMALT